MTERHLDIVILLENADQRGAMLSGLEALGVDASEHCRVSFRSMDDVPMERMQQMLVKDDRACLVVVWGANSMTKVLKERFSCPVLEIENGEPIPNVALTIAKFASLYSATLQARVHRHVESIRQAAFVENSRLKVASYEPQIARCFDGNLQILGDSIQLEGFQRFRGKVRDRWENDTRCVMITTDRQSGFDRQLAVVPFKGAVLNLCSQFWFEQTSDIIPNHLISIPHPSVAIVRRCQPFPIEFVVRYEHGYWV